MKYCDNCQDPLHTTAFYAHGDDLLCPACYDDREEKQALAEEMAADTAEENLVTPDTRTTAEILADASNVAIMKRRMEKVLKGGIECFSLPMEGWSGVMAT